MISSWLTLAAERAPRCPPSLLPWPRRAKPCFLCEHRRTPIMQPSSMGHRLRQTHNRLRSSGTRPQLSLGHLGQTDNRLRLTHLPQTPTSQTLPQLSGYDIGIRPQNVSCRGIAKATKDEATKRQALGLLERMVHHVYVWGILGRGSWPSA